MSDEQIYLSIIATVIGLLAIPAYYLDPGGDNRSVGSPKQTIAAGNEEPHVFTPTDVPTTELDLTKTTEEERNEIRNSWKININTASMNQLLTVPKIGPKTAEKIVQFRREGGEFYRVEDLTKIKRIGSKNVEYIKPHVTVGEKYKKMEPSESSDPTINVNEAGASELEKLPGIGGTYSERIIKYRNEKGSFSSLDELENVKGIGPKTLESLRDRATTH